MTALPGREGCTMGICWTLGFILRDQGGGKGGHMVGILSTEVEHLASTLTLVDADGFICQHFRC
jgi:hypothetical protein